MQTLRRLLSDVVGWLRPAASRGRKRPATRGGRRRTAGAVRRGRRRFQGINPRYVLIGGGVLGLATVGLALDVILGSPGVEQIRTLGHMPVATVVFDRQDKPAFTIYEEQRHEMPLAEISPNLVQATLAIEDQRFYEHRGLDLWRIGGSLLANLRHLEFVEGGSTITQQLARLTFLTPQKTIRRKLREAWLAVRIERQYTKDQILEMYLNKAYFGSGFYGVEAAAQGYFGKSASDLPLEEAALLAGLVKAPSAYAPDQHLDRALERRAVVLSQMAAAGMIDEAAAAELSAKPVTIVADAGGSLAWFKQAVTRELVDRFGWDVVATTGLRVYSTLDPVAQRAAEQAMTRGLDQIEARSTFRHPSRKDVKVPEDGSAPDYLQGALVALDPQTGEIRALVGGRDFADSQFDRVSQAHRQSGSAFKPFVYAAALELGYSPATLITGLDEPIPTPEGPWLPDDGHSEYDALTVRTALRVSSNRAAAQMLQTIGIAPAVERVRLLGLDAPPVPSLVLGTGDVTLLGLTTAYGAFANGGMLETPRIIRRVEDADGNVLFSTTEQSKRAVSEDTAFQMAEMLADVVDRGTGWQARQTGFQLPAAGKTGTTNDYRDAWFVGFTANLVAGVWVGFDRPRTIVPGGYASELAVPIWGAFMRDATRGHRANWVERPGDLTAVEICQDSGLLANSACRRVERVSEDGEVTIASSVITEYFKVGTEPHEHCPLHSYTFFRGVQTAAFDARDFPSSAVVGTLPAHARNEPDAEEVPAGPVTDEPTPEQGEEPQGERRGFWGRVFGVFTGGGDRDDSRDRSPRAGPGGAR